MFLSFYRLNEQPFGVTPDPKYLFWSRSHREALASLYYGIESGCGFMTLIASPGMGKTTLLFHLLERIRGTARTVYLFHTQCTSAEFIRYMMADLGCDANELDPVVQYGKLYDILTSEARAGRRFVLVIDEAQNLDDSVLETVRLLSDFETPSHKLMQVILAGQTQLATKLADYDLWQLRQRISIRGHIERLNPSEVTEYVEHRCKVAGYDGAPLCTDEANIDAWSYFSRERAPLFTTEALGLIASASNGIPREINNICFNALSLGFAARRRTITTAIIRDVISDLDLQKPVSLESVPTHEVEHQAVPEAPAVAQKPDTTPAVSTPVHRTAAEWNFRRSLEPWIRRASERRYLRIAASLVVVLIAGFVTISLMSRRPPAVRENEVHAASPAPVEDTVPTLAERVVPAGRDAGLYGEISAGISPVITVTIGQDANLDYLCRRYLGRKIDRQIIDEIQRLNPHITDPNRILSGERIRLPLAESAIAASTDALEGESGRE